MDTCPVSWDDRDTARLYRGFCGRHDRYRRANEHLVRHAGVGPGQRLLDVGAGLGHTAGAALPLLGPFGRVLCVEPAEAMRDLGRRLLPDPRVGWAPALPEAGRFDAILSSAALWQMLPIEENLRRLASLLSPGGTLAFNVPAGYLGEPDPPGGGDDPMLLDIPRYLVARHPLASRPGPPPTSDPLPSADELRACLVALGLRVRVRRFRWRMTQRAYGDWLKIPLNSQGMLPDLRPVARTRLLNAAIRAAAPDSWRHERWIAFAGRRPPI